MAFINCKDFLPSPFGPLSLGSETIDATGEKVAFMGRVSFAPGVAGPKDIRNIGFRFGSVTKAGGSALTVSLQDIDLTAGPPARPDGTQDQTVAIANANASFVSNTWITTGNLSADRTVAHGELLAVVIEYDGSGRLSSDTVQISRQGMGNANQVFAPGPALFTASWALSQARNNVVLVFSDGTFGTLDGAWIISGTTAPAISSSTTPDEVALKWTPPFTCKVDGAWLDYQTANAAYDFDVILYEGTTALQTVSVDANAVNSTSQNLHYVSFPETTLTASTAYYLAVRPSTTNNSVQTSFDVASAAHLDLMEGGQEMHYASRVNAGAWTATTTRRPNFGFRISARDFPSGGGGMLRHPGMSGGLN